MFASTLKFQDVDNFRVRGQYAWTVSMDREGACPAGYYTAGQRGC